MQFRIHEIIMPLLKKTLNNQSATLALWHLTEQPEDFFALYPSLERYRQTAFNDYHTYARRLEFLAERALLIEITGDEALEIGHEPSGRPVVGGKFISISHTRGYVALMLSASHEVGVDIEYRSERVRKIAPKFIRDDEAEEMEKLSTEEMLIIWCAKETAYKYFSADDLQYFEMRVSAIDAEKGSCRVENLKRGATLKIKIEATKEYILTLTE